MAIASPPDDNRSDPTDQNAPPADGAPEPPEQPAEVDRQPLTDLIPGEHRPSQLRPLMGRYKGPRNFDDQLRMAASLAKARFAVPRRYRDNPADVLAIMQVAQALDVDLPVAWDNVFFDEEGSSRMRARLMHALVIRAGHQVTPLEVSPTSVSMMIRRGDGKPGGGAQFTALEAATTGLLNRDDKAAVWTRFTEDSLWARCMSRLVRRYAPEVTLGMYEVADVGEPPLDDILEPDMSGVELDADGHPVPAPDVAELLSRLDPNGPLIEIRKLWRQAGEEGLLHRYAGVVGQVRVTVNELLFNQGNRAQAREEAAAAAAARAAVERETTAAVRGKTAAKKSTTAKKTTAAKKTTTTAAKKTPAKSTTAAKKTTTAAKKTTGAKKSTGTPARSRTRGPLEEPHPVIDAAAGTSGLLPCGCDAAAVLASGQHRKDCTGHVG
ncbi:hypothetical protein [Micromonospora sp. WMMC273]|uniref:hypothetical protein n=1 Tax=Micromonospora sp. WMMC273 TaxID=3015157 RepID=UPI0022B61998|nr:hypothetical protein [Micromonospora sp. WMMC273]MCZ7478838.1 hypothetical protein [Micromonospora sp. WMMC273]MCZ7478966.1 hypothetical protein [Micromonospora sp. WMMC273]